MSTEGRDEVSPLSADKVPRPGLSLTDLNEMTPAEFVDAIGHAFAGAPWIAERAWPERPFASVDAVHEAMVRAMYASDHYEQLQLIRAQPEPTVAGVEEAAALKRFYDSYHEKFAFPFVMFTRDSVAHEETQPAYPARLQHTREEEVATALREIAKAAWFRLHEAVREDADS